MLRAVYMWHLFSNCFALTPASAEKKSELRECTPEPLLLNPPAPLVNTPRYRSPWALALCTALEQTPQDYRRFGLNSRHVFAKPSPWGPRQEANTSSVLLRAAARQKNKQNVPAKPKRVWVCSTPGGRRRGWQENNRWPTVKSLQHFQESQLVF